MTLEISLNFFAKKHPRKVVPYVSVDVANEPLERELSFEIGKRIITINNPRIPLGMRTGQLANIASEAEWLPCYPQEAP